MVKSRLDNVCGRYGKLEMRKDALICAEVNFVVTAVCVLLPPYACVRSFDYVSRAAEDSETGFATSP